MIKKIKVFNAISASEGGALTVLREKLSAIESESIDEIICFTTVPSLLPKVDNVKLVDVSNFKGFKRFYWDLIGLNNFLKNKYDPTEVQIALVNFHNMSSFLPSFSNVTKLVLFHQAIAISDLKVKDYIFDRKLFFYNKIYPLFISLFDNNSVVYEVQREWVKSGLSKRNNIVKDRIVVLEPRIDIALVNNSKAILNGNFIFPSLYYSYKNHIILIKAIASYKSQYPKEHFKVYLTLEKKNHLYNEIIKLKLESYFVFVGYVSIDFILSFYREGGSLLFPSKIESLGLPLLEARYFNAYIISSDLPYAKEALNDYSKAIFVDPNNENSWALAINKLRKFL